MRWSLVSAFVVATTFTFGCASSRTMQVALEEPVGSSRLRGYPADPPSNRPAPSPAEEEAEEEESPPMRAHERSEGIGLPGPLRGSGQGMNSAAVPIDPGAMPSPNMQQAEPASAAAPAPEPPPAPPPEPPPE